MTHSILSLLVISCLVIVCSCQHEFKTDLGSAAKVCPVEWTLFHADAPTDISCAHKCYIDRRCLGVSYQWDNKNCIGCRAYNCNSTMAVSGSTVTNLQIYHYMVSGERPVPEHHLTASSSWYNLADHSPSAARLCTSYPPTYVGGWVAWFTTQNEWIQVRLWGISIIVAIANAGRKDSAVNQYVTVFKVLYSTDCIAFATVNDLDGNVMIFPGNTDWMNVVYNDLPYPVHALCVRIDPIGWNDYISMRFDLLEYEV